MKIKVIHETPLEKVEKIMEEKLAEKYCRALLRKNKNIKQAEYKHFWKQGEWFLKVSFEKVIEDAKA